MLLFVNIPLQPPLAVAVANQAAKAALTATCVWQAFAVVLIGQVSTTGGGIGTVKVDVQVVGVAQAPVTVKITVRLPPHLSGAPMLLLVKTPLQPPVKVAVASHAAYAALTWSCVKQAAVVVGTGQVSVTGGSTVQVKAWVQVAVLQPSEAV